MPKTKFKYKFKKLIGYYRYFYEFDIKGDFNVAREILEKTGQVTEIFINNSYALEYREGRRIY